MFAVTVNNNLYITMSASLSDFKSDESTVDSVLILALACQTADTTLEVSVSDQCELQSMLGSFAASWKQESPERFRLRVGQLSSSSMTLLGGAIDSELADVLNENNIPCVQGVLSNGRIEMLKQFREQSVTETVHRYGNIV